MSSSESNDTPEDARGKGFPQILHDRAKGSADRLQSLLVSLSTALIGVAFFALTSEVKPPLTGYQRYALFLVLLALAASLVTGLLGMRAETMRYLSHALALQRKQEGKKEAANTFFKSRDRWLKVERVSTAAQEASFVLGVLAVGIYAALRIQSA